MSRFGFKMCLHFVLNRCIMSVNYISEHADRSGQKSTPVYVYALLLMTVKRMRDQAGFVRYICKNAFRYRSGTEGGEEMSVKEDYERRTVQILSPIVQEAGFELVDVEYVKEGSTWYLRGYIDKPGGITVNDCEMVSRAFNECLEKEDFIDGSYVMEICSPGLDRPLKKPGDFERSLGELVEVRTYRPIDGRKEFVGSLQAYDDETVTIDEEGEPRSFIRKEIALIRLAVVF